MADGHRYRHRNKQPAPSGGRPHIESDDLLIDILSRLPVKTLVRFRCVCKSWRAFISDSHLITTHLRRFNSNPKLLVSVAPFQSIEIKSLNDAVSHVESSKLDLAVSVGALKIVGSCNGVICLLRNSDLVVFWNPSTRDTRFLPMLNDFCYGLAVLTFYGFGYDSIVDDYKVVFGFKSKRNDAFGTTLVMFSLKTESWRVVDGLDYVNLNGQGCLVNGALHWVEMKWKELVNIQPVLSARIMAFGLAEEMFQELVPLSYLCGEEKYISARIGIAGDGLFAYVYTGSAITMWVMKEYSVKESWSKAMQIPTEMPQHPQRYGLSFCNPICILENGEVLMNGRCLELYNPNEGLRVDVLHTPADLTLEPTMYVESLVWPFKKVSEINL